MLALNDEQRVLVEENMGLVGKVIKDCLKRPGAQGCYTYDDLFQIGCIGLCKAAQTNRPGRGAFSTYAYLLIRNEFYNELERSTRYAREVSSCYLELEDDPRQTDYDQQIRCRELMNLLEHAEAAATGITAKGIRALRMMAEGYSCKEISAQYGTTPNNITAWMSKARKFLASYDQLTGITSCGLSK